MRLQLKPQRVQLLLGELALEVGGAEFPLVRGADATPAVQCEHDDAESLQVERELHEIPQAHDTVVVGSEPCNRVEQGAGCPAKRGERE